MNNNTEILDVRNLTVNIAGRRVLDDVSFSARQGEVTALVGESGSGKTMTGLAVLGLMPPAAIREKGEIFFDGKDLFSLGREEMRKVRGGGISMVFQEPFTALNPVMRAGDQIREAFYAHGGITRIESEKRMGGLMDTVKLSRDVIARYPHELSGGMRQRLMLAIALACEPSVLILDEPTTALDVSIQKHILDLIAKIQGERLLAVIFITHDFSVVNMIADTVSVMKAGRVVESGRKNEILASPSHPYTKWLISCIPRLGDGRKRLPEYDWTVTH